MNVMKPGLRQFSRDAASSAAVGLGIAALGLATFAWSATLPSLSSARPVSSSTICGESLIEVPDRRAREREGQQPEGQQCGRVADESRFASDPVGERNVADSLAGRRLQRAAGELLASH